jgi:catechol 2,3-dioxygenase-like lactoylglutathione lyase family enzyme
MPNRPLFEAIHHLKFPVSDLGQALHFYERTLGATRLSAFDHVKDGKIYAYILDVPNLGAPLELRLDPERARSNAGFDPVTLAVRHREDLEAWTRHLDALGVPHSPVLAGAIGWLIVFADPDGLRLRLYTHETHGPEVQPTPNSQWL